MYSYICSIEKATGKIELSLRQSDTGVAENIPTEFLANKRLAAGKVEAQTTAGGENATKKRERKRKASATVEDGDLTTPVIKEVKKKRVEEPEEEMDSGVEVREEVDSDPEVKVKVVCSL